MKQSTLFLLFCFILSACYTTDQNTTKNDPSSKTVISHSVADSLPFPQSWLGYWEGNLDIFKNNQIVQTIPMVLELLEMDGSENFVWTIIYGEDQEAGRRPYELEILDADKGLYLMDEKNSIKLESYLFENKLMSWYEVMGNQILSIQEKRGDQMVFEIVFGSSEPVSITGDQKFEGEEIPAVRTFPIGGYQRAVLNRRK